jgi:mRNA interferase MazF
VDQLKRGDVVIVALAGDYGKPRPALVIQSDLFNETHASVTIVPLTSTLVDAPIFRLTVEPSRANGLRSLSQLMIDKVTTVSRSRIAQSIGRLEDDLLLRVSRALALWVGIAT